MRIDLCHGIARASYLRKRRESENHSPVQGKKIRIYDSAEITIKLFISSKEQNRGKGLSIYYKSFEDQCRDSPCLPADLKGMLCHSRLDEYFCQGLKIEPNFRLG